MFKRKWATASLSAFLMAVFPGLASAEAGAARDGNPLASASDFRVARPTNALEPLRRFYVDGLGLEVIAQFADHDGFDGLIVRLPGTTVQIEFTVAHGHTAPRSPTEDHLLVFYVPQPALHRALVERMQANGYSSVPSFNPYWDRYGVTFSDPDGYRVVVVDGAFPPR